MTKEQLDEFERNKTVHKITASVIANQFALVRNEELKHTKYYQKRLKMVLNPCIKELIKLEPMYDQFFDAHDKSTDDVFQVYSKFVDILAVVPIFDMPMIANMYNAYLSDRKSMEGITNKILKNKK